MYVRLWRKADIWQTSDVGEEPTVDIGCRLNGAAGSVQHADFPRMVERTAGRDQKRIPKVDRRQRFQSSSHVHNRSEVAFSESLTDAV